jgi:hypothetical protein
MGIHVALVHPSSTVDFHVLFFVCIVVVVALQGRRDDDDDDNKGSKQTDQKCQGT